MRRGLDSYQSRFDQMRWLADPQCRGSPSTRAASALGIYNARDAGAKQGISVNLSVNHSGQTPGKR